MTSPLLHSPRHASELIATVPEHHTAGVRDGMVSFELPMPMPGLTVKLL